MAQRVASYQTLRRNRKTRITYAYSAIERESMCGDSAAQQEADVAMDALHSMSVDDMMNWALREIEHLELNHFE